MAKSVGLGTAALSLTLLAAAPAWGAATVRTHAHAAAAGSQLVSYTALANAPGVGITGVYMGVSLDLPEASSSLSTGGVGAGLASLAWPGDIGGNAGTAVLVLDPTAPSWVTILNDPVKAESHSTGTHHALSKSLPGTVMESSATHKLVTASSKTSLSIGALGSLGVFTGSSSAKLIGPHTIRSTADSAFTDIKLAGGLVKLGALTSRAVVVSNGKTTHGHAKTTVGGVTIAGIPVSIDRQGIHLATAVIPTKAITSLLTNTLEALHLTTTFTPTLVTKDGAASSYDAGALVINYHPSGGTTNISITLGRAAAQVNATPSLLPPTFTPPPASTGTPSTAPGGGSSLGGSSASLPPGDTTTVGPSDQPPSIAHRIANRASSILLAGGPTGAMIFGLVAATILCAIALPHVAGRFLDAPADAGCEEDQ